jgi:disulfide bond formation protein DsbB
MVASTRKLTSNPAYKAGGLALVLAIAAIAGAFGFERIGGYLPCPLCLQQRWAYYAGIPVLFLSLVLVSGGRASIAAGLLLLVSLGFLANAGLGIYHAGVEWKFWPGPDTCAAVQQTTATSATDLLKSLPTTRVVRCDAAPFTFAGLSLAGWNAVVSFVISMAALKAAFLASEQRA